MLGFLGSIALYFLFAVGLGAGLGETIGERTGKDPRLFAGIGAGVGLLTLGAVWLLSDRDPPAPPARPQPSVVTLNAPDDAAPDAEALAEAFANADASAFEGDRADDDGLDRSADASGWNWSDRDGWGDASRGQEDEPTNGYRGAAGAFAAE